jgi:hypothetical protein
LTTVVRTFSSHHSTEPPAWVESDDPALAELVSRHFGCPIGRPNNWKGRSAGDSSVVPSGHAPKNLPEGKSPEEWDAIEGKAIKKGDE